VSLPTQREIILNAIAALEAARSSLSEARNWLHSDWRPAGSPLPPAAAEARSSTLRTVGSHTIDIEAAKRSLYDALEQLGAQSAGRTGSPGCATDSDVRQRSV
jgi:hypothetical protein